MRPPALSRFLRLPFPWPEATVLTLAAAWLAFALLAGPLVRGLAAALLIAAAVRYAPRWRAWFWLRVTYLRLDKRPSFSSAAASVTFDQRGIPTIRAASRQAAVRALGYVMARERFFQMDTLRRQAAGRLAELLGSGYLARDLARRRLGLSAVAARARDGLPADQLQALAAFSRGANEALERCGAPFEFRLLRQRPEPWTPRDSLLVALELHYQLSFDYETERMLTVMRRTLPPEVVEFLTPRGGRRLPAVPVAALSRLPAGRGVAAPPAAPPPRGSNAWAVSAAHTATGAALLANDLHLPLSVPNLLFAATVAYEGRQLTGFAVPGLPMFLSGTTREVAWGTANLYADCLDLIELEPNPEDPNEYRTPSGWQRFSRATEIVQVRGGRPVVFDRLSTIWGPVVESSLLGKPIAVHWTGLDPSAVNLDLIYMDRAATVDEALQVAAGLQGPPLAVLVADALGSIGWLGSGPLPIRRGIDGETAEPWSDGDRGWAGYVPPAGLPRSANPSFGVLVAANHRPSPAPGDPSIGHNFGNDWRARRILAELCSRFPATPDSMRAVQHDDDAGFYEFYRRLALSLLDGDRDAELHGAIGAWDGRAAGSGSVLTTLTIFRELLLDRVFGAFLRPCRAVDGNFRYAWRDPEPALRTLLEAAPPELLAGLDPAAGSWPAYLRAILFESEALSDRACARWPPQAVRVSHPLSVLFPGLREILDMPVVSVPGCAFCVRVSTPTDGAVARLVASPGGRPELQMPCGQSGHPLSPFYRSEHAAWAGGQPDASGRTPDGARAQRARARRPSGL